MNEQYIQDLYNGLGGQAKFGAYDDFRDLIQNDQSYRSDFYNAFGEGTLGAFSDFESLVKKKEEEGLPDQSQSPNLGALASQSAGTSLESSSPSEQQNQQILALGRGPLAKMPSEVAPQPVTQEQIQEAVKIRPENIVMTTKVKDLVNSGVKESEAIASIAKEYEMPEEDVKFTVDKLKPYQETPYFTEDSGFGAALQAMRTGPLSNPVLSTISEFIDDMGRSLAEGYKQAGGVKPSTDLMIALGDADAETVRKFIEAGNELNKIPPSDEMVRFRNIVEDEGGGTWGLIKGLAMNPTVGPQVMASSLASMANSVSLAAAGSVVGTAGAYGAAAGEGVGAIPAMAASLPYAMAAASSTLEAAMTFQELVSDELKMRGLNFDEEGVKQLLEDEEAMRSIRARALARGATIGSIDAITGKVATKIAAKPRLSSLSRAGQVAKTAAVQSIGGSIGEAAGRFVAGQPMDVVEIGLEGLAEAPMSAVDIVSATFNRPSITINGEKANETELNNILDSVESGVLTADEFRKMNITVNNDVAGYGKRISDIIETDDIRKNVRQASPDIDDESLNRIVELEKELSKLEGNKTQSAKDRRSQISSEIKTIQENAVQKPTTEEGVLRAEQPQVGLQEVGEGDKAKEFTQKSIADAEQAKQVELPKIETVEQNEAGISTGEKPDKILFLDVNGVINAGSSMSGDVLPQLMAHVNRIIEETGAKVVISSDERMGDLNATREKMKQYGFKHADKIIGETSIDKEGDQEFRGDKIENWKNTFAPDATIVALDDNDPGFKDNQKSSLVSPSRFLGMNEDLANKAIAKLNKVAGSEAEAIVQNTFPSDEEIAVLDEMESSVKAAGKAAAPAVAPTAAPTAQGVSMKDKIASNELASRTPDTAKAKIIRQSIKAVNTIKSLFPEFDIVVHENEESFNQAMERGKNASLRGAGGAMTRIKTPDGKVSVQVHINLDKASVNTVPHEVAHAVMLKAFGDDPQLFRTFRDRISKILSDDRVKQLNDFASQYSESESYEEFLVELAAVLATNKDKLNKATVSKILELINKVVSKITGGAFVPFKATAEATATNDLVDFFNSMSKSIAAGEAVEVTEKGKVKIAEGVVSKGQRISAQDVLSVEPLGKRDKKIAEVASAIDKAVDIILSPSSPSEKRIQRFLSNAYNDLRYFFSDYKGETGLDWYTNKMNEFNEKLKDVSDIAIQNGEMPESNSLRDPENMDLFRAVLALSSIGVNPLVNVKAAFSIWKTYNRETGQFEKYQPGQVSVRTKLKDKNGEYFAPSGTIVKETKTAYDVRGIDGKTIRVKKSDLTPGYNVTYEEVNSKGKKEEKTKELKLIKKSSTNYIFKKGDGVLKIPIADVLNMEQVDNGLVGKGWTVKGNVIAINLDRLESLISDQGGVKNAIKWLNSKHPISELRKYNEGLPDANGSKAKKNPVGERFGSYIIGEKLGAFHQNVAGTPTELTMDLWWSRTWNRYMGTLMTINEKGKPDIQETPRTDAERAIMRQAADIAAKELGLEVHELQAALWYLEQQMYKRMGAAVESYSFVDGVNQLLLQYGKSKEEIQPERYGISSSEVDRRRSDAATRAASVVFGEGGEVRGEIVTKGRRGGDGGGRGALRSLAPLEGAPIVEGATGPDPEIVNVAEKYAKDNGIDLKRQSEYVQVDEDFARKLAKAYDEMKDDPNNPKVKEAYKDLIDQTKKQYDALVEAGYEFTFFDSKTDPYDGKPWRAIRDLRNNKKMAVYGTYDGFGTEGLTDKAAEGNPMLQDTGLVWKDQNGKNHAVTANDLFRAVHDAFGHGMEGSGFRARGEENAWQAHVRLFTGPAVAAITTETRGQNSWLNYGPYGEENQSAKVEDTVFAEQKTGLLPEWAWTENRAGDQAEPEIVTKGRKAEKVSELENILSAYELAVSGGYSKEEQSRMSANERRSASIKKSNAKKTLDAMLGFDIGDLPSQTDKQRDIKNAISYLNRLIGDGRFAKYNDVKELSDAYIKAKEDNSNPELVKSVEAIIGEPEIVTKGRKAEELSEANMPGYDATMEKVGGIIAKTVDRGGTKEQAFDNVMRYLEKSKLYTDATDVQREQLVRDIRDRFYKKEKAAPSAERLLGIKDTKKVTMSEKEALKKRLTDEARGARNAASAIKKAQVSISEELKEMVKSGKISLRQMTIILNRFSKLNSLNEDSVSKFVDYMVNVMEDAEYADKISSIRKMIPTAKKNIMTKLGTAEGLIPNLQKILNVNPTFIPAEVFNKYMGLVEMLGKRQAVLDLQEINDVTKTSDEIMNAIDQKLSVIDELADRFMNSENKVYDDNGNLDYSKTVEKMADAGEVSVEELELMKANKSKIYSDKKGPTDNYIYNRINELMDDGDSESESISQVSSELGVDESVVRDALDRMNKEKNDLVGVVYSLSSSMDPERFETEDERALARRLKRLLDTDAVESMSLNDLRNIVKMVDNINNGYVSNFAQIMSERLESVLSGSEVKASVKSAKPMPVSKMIGKIKSVITGSQNFYDEIIKRGINYYIDQSLGDFKTKRVFNAVFEKAAEALSRYEYELNRITDILDKAQERVAKSFGMDHNKTVESKYKMMAYMLQLEYESNKGAKVNPAMAFLKETAKFIESNTTKYNDNDLKIIKDIMKNYRDEKGQIDSKKLYDSFNQSEKDAIRTMQEVNKSLRGKAVYTSSVIRGDRIRPLDNYIHHSVMHEDTEAARMKDVTSASSIGESMKPSTKAKSLISRTGAVTPLNLDPFAAVHKGSSALLLDYHLTAPIRTARRTFNQARVQMKRSGEYSSNNRKIVDAIENAFENTLEDLLSKSFNQSSLVSSALEYISKQGYRAVLASGTRAISELASNIGFAIFVEPEAMSTGWKNRSILMSEDAPQIMFNLKSKQTNRIYPADSLSGRLIDPNIINQVSGIKNARSKTAVGNQLNKIHNKVTKKYMNVVELTADTLISTPDKLVMRPIWFGSFINEFKKITGIDPDMTKIAQNDEAYMDAYSEALDSARNTADEASVRAASSNNAFMTSVKGKNIKGTGITLAAKIAYNNFNNFMTTFLMYEYITARTGVMAAVGNGMVSKKKGAAMLAGVTTRMMVYSILSVTLANALANAVTGGDDDDEQDKKSFLQSLGQQFASAFTSLMFGRDFGQAARSIINYGVEEVNEDYMDFLREGEYDPYKDAIQYTIVPRGKKKADLGQVMMKMGGSYGPALSTASLVFEKAVGEEKKEAAAKKREEEEMYMRIPLQIAGTAGLVPLYKDVDRIVKKEIYRSLEQAEKISQKRKLQEERELGGYKSKEEMMENDPEMYKQKYGPGSIRYQLEKTKKEIEKQKNKLKKMM